MNLPSDFILRTRELLGDAEFAALTEALEKDTPVSIRMNTDKSDLVPLESTSVPWCREGYYLSGRPSFTFDPLFHAGCYYVQEASSMFLEQALRQYVHEPVTMLDLCAAPGGKSTLARSVLPEGSLLVANEVMRNRSQVLAENLIKWGNPGVIVTNNDPADFTEYNREENEDNVAWIAQELGAEVLPLETQPDWHITGNLTGTEFPVYRFLPHKTTGEGLFMAVLRKTVDEPAVSVRTKTGGKASKKGKGGKVVALQVPKEMKAWVQGAGDYVFEVNDSEAMAFPAAYKDTYDLLKSQLRILHAGISLGELKGKDWQPSHALAMSTVFERDSFPMAELTYPQAIAYLRKEAVVLSPEVPRGYVTLTYQGQVLGFAKNIGNRANNLYPQEWRIRSGYLPEIIPDLFG